MRGSDRDGWEPRPPTTVTIDTEATTALLRPVLEALGYTATEGPDGSLLVASNPTGTAERGPVDITLHGVHLRAPQMTADHTGTRVALEGVTHTAVTITRTGATP